MNDNEDSGKLYGKGAKNIQLQKIKVFSNFSYVEHKSMRNRYVKQAVLFVEMQGEVK